MKTKNFYTEIIVSTLTGIVLSCGDPQRETVSKDEPAESQTVLLTHEQWKNAGITLGKIERRYMAEMLQVNGKIEVPPSHNVSISVPYGGFIKTMVLLPGSVVKKHEVLFSIENPDFIEIQQQYLENLSRRDFLKVEKERQAQLFSENVVSAKAYQQAESEYLMNEARIKGLEEKLRLIGLNPEEIRKGRIFSSVQIFSPIDGIVSDVYANVGKYINPKDVVMDITNTEDLHVELELYEKDMARVRKGQAIYFYLPAVPDSIMEAYVHLVGATVREDRSVTIHGHLHRPYAHLRPGMYVMASIEIDKRSCWAVPESALVRYRGRYYIFVFKGEKLSGEKKMHCFSMMEINKGAEENGWVEIMIPQIQRPDTFTIATQGSVILLAQLKNKEEE